MKHISFFLAKLGGGGAEKNVLKIINQIIEEDNDYKVSLILINEKGSYIDQLSDKCEIIILNSKRLLFSFWELSKVLNRIKPDVLISTLIKNNIIAIISKIISNIKCKLILVNQNNFSKKVNKNDKKFEKKLLPLLTKILYRFSDNIITSSEGVKLNLKKYINVPEYKYKVIYNPIVNKKLIDSSKESINCSLFNTKKPIILSAGRLVEQKDFFTLIKAFAKLYNELECRLVILGKGEKKESLIFLASDLGIKNELFLPGFVDNPYKFMRRASVFVLSSRWEGFGNVIVEAMACKTPVVSTNCPYGPDEIITHNENGLLSPVGDYEELKNNIKKILMDEKLNNKLSKNGFERAKDFKVKEITSQYLDTF